MTLIKSHSNYVLKKRHQDISDGTIWERDITTIGGVNQFAPGQIPIYKSSNFIITVRNDGKIANQYNKTKWKESENGDIWTLETISGMTSEFEDQNDVKIVLKQDYYDFRDFAYYGSLTEMFRAAINHIIQEFPGELYLSTSESGSCTSGMTEDGEKIEWIEYFNSNGHVVSNPFGIDIHSLKKPQEGNPLKYFADEGYKNYEIIVGDAESGTPVTSWKSEITDKPFCPNNKIAVVTIGDDYEIEAWVGDNNKVIYLSTDDNIHIRPSEQFIVDFYNSCSNFEKIILDRNTTPKYKAIFSVIKESERGYYRKMETFEFPKADKGGYNLDVLSDSYSDYTVRLAEIGSYYDEYFTDNLWRSMTHEAIKNFDWTFTREFTYGDETEYVHGGEKMQKALRIFAREFDEILSYINNIKNVGRVTYDERSNIPDYFLIDEVENKGWDVCLVYPYDLKELSGNTVIDDYSENFQLSGSSDGGFIRQFSQNTKKEVSPYTKEWIDDYPEGYFISCCGVYQPCQYDGSPYYLLDASGSGSTYYDACDDYNGTNRVRNRIKSFTDERKYTYLDASNEFMRRMAINSPYILRHKGTIEGIEMILGMFGLKSKSWVENLYSGCTNSGVTYDYDITEYSSFAERIEEKWDAVHQMYRYDWLNSTKTIVYDYRSMSNYTKYGAQPNYESYQGLPVSSRYEDLEFVKDKNGNYEYDNGEIKVSNKAYIEVSPLYSDPSSAQSATSNVTEAFKTAETNKPVRRRFLYPHFGKYEQLDGNPYFQMDGGWLSKTVENSGGTRYNFQFDVDDNIAYTVYKESGETKEDGTVIDNNPIYKETIRNIKRVDTLNDLITTPIDILTNGTIYYVSNFNKEVAIINNEVCDVNYEYNKNDSHKPFKYVNLVKNDNYIKIGDDLFFDKEIHVYDENGNAVTYSLQDKEYGYKVKAYIHEGKEPQFICYGDDNMYYTIDSFLLLNDEITSAATNYFIIDDTYYSNRISVNNDGMGWRLLYPNDPEYIRINTIKNYYEGNNPHNGNMAYDSGHKYLTYFKRLFKHAIDNDLFDERCYESFYSDMDNEISLIGFNGLIDNNEDIKQYNPYLTSGDSKLHYFGNFYKKHSNEIPWYDATSAETVNFYGLNEFKRSELEHMYKELDDKIIVSSYTLSSDTEMIGGSPYSAYTSDKVDDVTDQILNNKRLTITFYLHECWHSNQGQCELKYLDDIVMNYLTQMIPSTAIVDIRYIAKCGYVERWEADGTQCDGVSLYETLRKFVSYDGGSSWERTDETTRGELIEENSEQCGYREEWRNEEYCVDFDLRSHDVKYVSYDYGETFKRTDEYANDTLVEHDSTKCGYIPPIEPEYRDIDTGYTCQDCDKYELIEHQVSYDGGNTWTTTSTTIGDLIEKKSGDCGYETRWITGETCFNANLYKSMIEQERCGSSSEWINTGAEYRTEEILVQDSYDCGYRERWEADGTQCDGVSLYETLRKFVSRDSGTTWSETSETKRGDLIKEKSEDCGYVSSSRTYSACSDYTFYEYRQDIESYDYGETWIDVGDPEVIEEEHDSTKCGYIPPIEPEYRDIDTGYTCQNVDKYKLIEHQVSYDSGNTWATTSTTIGDLIEEKSEDCGYVSSSRTYSTCDDCTFYGYEQAIESYDYGETWTDVGDPVVITEEHNSPLCGYVSSARTYSACSDYTFYEYRQAIESCDYGETWTDVGDPEVIEEEHDSTKCGYVPPQHSINIVIDNVTCDYVLGGNRVTLRVASNTTPSSEYNAVQYTFRQGDAVREGGLGAVVGNKYDVILTSSEGFVPGEIVEFTYFCLRDPSINGRKELEISNCPKGTENKIIIDVSWVTNQRECRPGGINCQIYRISLKADYPIASDIKFDAYAIYTEDSTTTFNFYPTFYRGVQTDIHTISIPQNDGYKTGGWVTDVLYNNTEENMPRYDGTYAYVYEITYNGLWTNNNENDSLDNGDVEYDSLDGDNNDSNDANEESV